LFCFWILFDFLYLAVRSGIGVRAENLFLRKQLAFYAERKIKARRADNGSRIALALLSKFFAWKDALVIAKPETLIRWNRKGFRLFWAGYIMNIESRRMQLENGVGWRFLHRAAFLRMTAITSARHRQAGFNRAPIARYRF
jgi:hypothetical protein